MTNIDWQDEFERLFLSSDKEKIKKSISIKNENMPKKLYKYRKVDQYALDCLLNKQIWCTTLDNYNDIYEGNIETDFLELQKNVIWKEANKIGMPDMNIINAKTPNELATAAFPESKRAKYIKKYQSNKISTENRIKKQINEIQHSTKICSFSDVKPYGNILENSLMWAHYGDNYKGFCIEYDTKKTQQNFYPVFYAETIFNISEFLSKALVGDKDIPKILSYYSAMKKLSSWQYEKEWRIILVEDNKKKHENIQSLEPSAIYLGPSVSSLNKFILKNIADNLLIPIYATYIPQSEYKLEYNELN